VIVVEIGFAGRGVKRCMLSKTELHNQQKSALMDIRVHSLGFDL
jgi:hypothetical protein